VLNGDISETELEAVLNAAYKLVGHGNLEMLDLLRATPDQLCAAISAEFEARHYPVIFVDQLQALRFAGRNIVQEIGDATKGLRALARKHNAAVVLLCQLNRETARNAGGVPALSNLRDSGDIEQDADVVIFIHHEGDPGRSKAWLNVAANRYGSTGPIAVRFDGPTTSFSETGDQQ
jgi:replicative DNA helicase